MVSLIGKFTPHPKGFEPTTLLSLYIYIYIILEGRREEEVLFELELIASVFYVHIMAKAMI